MRIRQPCMEREHGYLNGKSQEDQQESEQLQAHRNPNQWNRYRSNEEVRREKLHARGRAAHLEVEQQDACQHKDTAEKRVQQEFPGRVNTPWHAMLGRIVAPDADQEK